MRHRLQAKVLRRVRPVRRVHLPGARGLGLPSACQTQSITGNEAQRAAGAQCSLVDRALRRVGRWHRLRHARRKGVGVLAHDGLREGVNVQGGIGGGGKSGHGRVFRCKSGKGRWTDRCCALSLWERAGVRADGAGAGMQPIPQAACNRSLVTGYWFCAWCQNGVPSTGVLGCAACCGCMAPARCAWRPACTASAKAPAMATGSCASATAVFSSTPS